MTTTLPTPFLSWFGIFRLGLVQTALGSIVVLTTSTLNRVMVVELALPAMLPGLLVGLHYAMQMSRPRWGHGSDVGGRRTPWIIGGIAVLAVGGVLASSATALMEVEIVSGTIMAALAFVLIGAGVGAAGTSLLALLAKRVEPTRRAAAATIVWVMMIAGFIITAAGAGHNLDPFSTSRLIAVTSVVAACAFVLAVVALAGVEGPAAPHAATRAAADRSFGAAIAEVWSDPKARRFTIFVGLSMFAYSAQDLILEPYAGTLFGLTPGQTTKLSGVQHSGVLLGMVMAGGLSSGMAFRQIGSLRSWTVGGCLASAVALTLIAVAGLAPDQWRIEPLVFGLGLANGAFAVAAIGSMMALAGDGASGREGVRMGVWGAAQAIAFGVGGVAGAAASDIVRWISGSMIHGYLSVFLAEAVLFLFAALLAMQVGSVRRSSGAIARPRLTDQGALLLPKTSEAHS